MRALDAADEGGEPAEEWDPDADPDPEPSSSSSWPPLRASVWMSWTQVHCNVPVSQHHPQIQQKLFSNTHTHTPADKQLSLFYDHFFLLLMYQFCSSSYPA